MKTDYELQADVLSALSGVEDLVVNDIGVAVHDGVVTLTGVTDSLMKRLGAARYAEGVVGVQGVANEIVVRLPSDQSRTDTEIANDAVNALMWDTEVPDKTIKVRVQDRWIWLVGEADSDYQRIAAEHAVERIAGVKGVTNFVRIKRQATAAMSEINRLGRTCVILQSGHAVRMRGQTTHARGQRQDQ